ncbi:sulfatase-like hydrolase/transferase [Paraferrimonas sp. SM1919]|uniref:sulfatase-like hydrolase/transferase n=1 Tax=Paraferrimonas sp. SM1919 TaxID=2662263 RepID=UPI0013D09F41|nr:sulfatase-like hydrolase/transferase [Paraferrimonas sp. SM1919]
MKWNDFVRGFTLVSSLFMANAFSHSAQPNIVLILTDDQSYGMMGVTGNPVVETPNIDALANEGVFFSNAHVTSSICTPSRVSTLLGQYERMHNVNFNSGTAVSKFAWEQSYPHQFKQAGYYTGWIGKNHVPVGKHGYQTGLMEKSFDYWYAGHGHMFFYPKFRHSIFSEAHADTQAEIIQEGVTDFLDSNEYRFKKALTFFDRRPTDKPFMLSINFNLPHNAGTSNMKQKDSDGELYTTKYRNQEIPLPEHYVAKKDIKQPKLPASLLRSRDRQFIYDYVDTPETLKERQIRQYQAMTGIDNLVGHLRHSLEQQGLADNTIIIFTSDHGLFMGEHGLGGKSLCYEKTNHVPLIVFDPRAKPTGKRNALVQNIDLAPTMLALAGLEAPSSMQGENFSPSIYEDKPLKRQYAFAENLWSTHFGNPRCEAIQDSEWKYIRYFANHNLSAVDTVKLAKKLNMPVNKLLYGTHDNDVAQYMHYVEASIKGEQPVYEELYHLKSDPDELMNLAQKHQHHVKLEQLRASIADVVKQARGRPTNNVVRYTLDSNPDNK